MLQPLDVVLFQPYKHYHGQEIDEATRTGCTNFDKTEFLASLGRIRLQAFKETSILSGFRKTGIVPYDPQIVLEKLQELQTRQEEELEAPIE